ncbi:MAG: cyclopropane fatty acyl phospholipid synthase [Gammaproteobacteria bacterium]|nr:cyclopropane fatty acyl phospholipid synthase [Gammaproteobacteria bacterium]MCP5407701.1 cyclopropane fatty acyl phospholipid synthase [Chromatiaceae bacterium]MCP5441689.1 cyclopropane fatty acyl phospholipid synthase [Chromatiaceae bacterium]
MNQSAGSGANWSNPETLDSSTRMAPMILTRLIAPADVAFNGNRPWDIQVNDPETYDRILYRGSLGFGEAYMDGMWDCLNLDELFTRLLRFDIDRKVRGILRIRLLAASAFNFLSHKLVNLQSRRRAFQVAECHYDIGNDVYRSMLDSTMSYSCGYWHNASSLEQAQRNKLDLICRKLELAQGERLLDIGCGWGGLARHAAEHYGVEVVGISVSEEQRKLALERCRDLPVEIALMDYRDLTGRFDKVASVGMFEHVGPKNYVDFFRTVRRVMSDTGLFLLHTIGNYCSYNSIDPWIDRYIFPNGHLPSASQITAAIEPDFIVRDWHDFGPDYDRTLMAWWKNFDSAWPDLKERYGERFYRMWKYYLHCCAGMFRSGHGQLWQIVLSNRGVRPEYRSIR